MDADSTLDILIRLGVIGQADAKAARDLLNETAVAAREAGKGADYLNPAFANSVKNMDATAESAKKLGSNYRLLALGAEQAGVNIPGLSVLLRGLFNPTFIGLAAGIAAVETYFGHLQKLQEKQLEWTKELQKTNDALHEITSSGKSAGEQLIEINKAIADGQVKARGHAAEIEHMTNLWKRYDEAVKDAAAAEKESDADSQSAITEKISLLEKAGLVSKENADALRAEAEFEAEQAKVRAERNEKEAAYNQTLRNRNEAQDKMDRFPSQGDRQALTEKDQKALDRNEAILKDMPGVIAKLEADRKTAMDNNNIHDEIELNRQIIEKQAVLNKAIAANPDLEKKVAQDADAEKAFDSLKTTVENLNAQLNTMAQGMADFEKSSSAHEDAAAHQRDLKEFGGGAADLLTTGEAIAQRFRQNPNSVSQADQQSMVRIAEAASGRTQNAKSAMGVLLEAAQNIHAQQDDLDRIVATMEKIAIFIPGLTDRIARIEARISRATQ